MSPVLHFLSKHSPYPSGLPPWCTATLGDHHLIYPAFSQVYTSQLISLQASVS